MGERDGRRDDVEQLGRRQPSAPGQDHPGEDVGYGLGRLWVEALRIDDATRLAGLRVNIWVSLLAITASAVELAVLRHRQRHEPPASPPNTTVPVLGRPGQEHPGP